MSEDELAAAAAVIIAVVAKQKNKKSNRAKRKYWVKPWLARRPQLGIYETLLLELRLEEERNYKNYLRMTTQNFDEILGPLERDVTNFNFSCHFSYFPHDFLKIGRVLFLHIHMII